MNRNLRFLPFLLTLLAAPALAQETATPPPKKPEPPQHTFLWKVEKEGLAVNYCFGTIHVPDDRIHALHAEVKAAMDQADALIGELDLSSTEGMKEKILEAGTLPEGQSLKALLPADLWEDLDDLMTPYGMRVAMLDRLQPFMIGLTLAQLDIMDESLAGKKPLDVRLFAVANHKGMQVGCVETIDEQVNALAHTLTQEESIVVLREAVDQMKLAKERGVSELERVMRAWLSGSERYLLALAMESWKPGDPLNDRVREALLYQRNRNMAARSAKLMREHPETRHVFAFGAFHFIGEQSVVELLRKDGFTVTRLTAPTPEEEQAIMDSDPWLEKPEQQADGQ
jgi:uncharacterized protein YbaP (TraB family)